MPSFKRSCSRETVYQRHGVVWPPTMGRILGFKHCSGFLIVLAVLAHCYQQEHTTKVTTKFGRIRGLWSRSTRGRLVAYYLGVPYAEPPLGDLRFRSPKAWNRTWSETFQATKNAPMCVQLDNKRTLIGSEDCLYLNIYVPMLSEKREQNRTVLPVMAHVHGGKFQFGSNRDNELPPKYMMDQNVILVVINYRLNMFGFLSTGSKASPGNYGIKDVLLSLHWIRENIGSFHGDPNRVTLWGHSAGATIAHMLALTDKTEGLFNRYILQSGSALCPWSLDTKSWAKRVAFQSAKLLDCLPPETAAAAEEEHNSANGEQKEGNATTVQPERTIDIWQSSEVQQELTMLCLRDREIDYFELVLKYFSNLKGDPCCVFAPIIEEESNDAVVTIHPLMRIKNRLYRDIPFIIGVTENEGLYRIIGNEVTMNKIMNDFETRLPFLLEYYQLISNTTAFADAIENFYFHGNFTLNLQQNITEAITDAVFMWPTYQTLMYQSQFMNSSTYFYLFSYEGTFTSTFDTGNLIHYGISHADDLNYLIPLLNVKYKNLMLHNTEKDITMINIMTEMWANFADKGVPMAWRVQSWPNWKESHEFLRFGNGKQPELILERDFFSEKVAFWEELSTNISPVEPECLVDPSFDENQSSRSSCKKYDKILVCLLIMFVIL